MCPMTCDPKPDNKDVGADEVDEVSLYKSA